MTLPIRLGCSAAAASSGLAEAARRPAAGASKAPLSSPLPLSLSLSSAFHARTSAPRTHVSTRWSYPS